VCEGLQLIILEPEGDKSEMNIDDVKKYITDRADDQMNGMWLSKVKSAERERDEILKWIDNIYETAKHIRKGVR
jgi:hypothetical protein